MERRNLGRSSPRRPSVLRLLAAVLGLCLFGGFGAITFVHDVRWRAAIVFDKATSKLPDIGWSDLLSMLRPGSGIYLEQLAETRNPFEVIESPRRSKADLEDGERLFNEHCSSCHGSEARGGVGGPSLYDHSFRQGSRPWALYRTIRLGVPNTAMAGRDLPRDDIWKLVSYLGDKLATRATLKASSGGKPSHAPLEPVTESELRAADDRPSEWLTYSGSYTGHRHSRLHQISRDNIGQLRLEWERQFSGIAESVETSPIVRGATMFVTEPPNRVHALDAVSGRLLWTYSRDLPSHLLLCCGPVNRGVAVLGDRVFVGTLDAHLLALDANTGKLVWDVAVADQSSGYSITGAPLVVGDMIVTGVGGGEFGIRGGIIDAYDAASGKRRWRFYTVPAPGEPGSNTWSGDSAQRGGASTWLTGSFDPELRLIYWGVGNPSPNYYGENRKGDNLYANSVVALDADTGKLRWYFQFTPHDLHDWDAVQVPILVDMVIDKTERKVLAWANRNGFYYLLDRKTGKFLLGTPFAKQTWADGLDANGRPRVRPESIPSRQGSIVYPSVYGATNWWSPTYDAASGLLYVPTIERGSVYYASPDRPSKHDGLVLGSWGVGVPGEGLTMAVKALDVTTGRVRWQYARPPRPADALTGGLLSTAGHVVFGGDGETLFALDSETGNELWHFDAGGRVVAAPVTYEVAGRQYMTIAAGHTIMSFALPRP